MRYSLLYPALSDGEISAAEDESCSEAVFNFSIDRSVESFCTDLKKRSVFLSVLSHPCTDVKTVLYRQNILRDFSRMPQVFAECQSVFGKIEAVKSEWDFQRRKLYSLKRTNVAETSLDDYRALLSITSSYSRKVFDQLKKVESINRSGELTSPGLPDISAAIAEMTESPAFAEIEKIAEDCQSLSSRCIFDLSVTLNDSLRIVDTAICGIEHVDLNDLADANASPVKNMLKLFRKPSDRLGKIQPKPVKTEEPEEPKKDVRPPVRVFDIDTCDKEILISAMREFENLMTRLLRLLCDMFAGAPREMMFYETALSYLSAMRFKNTPTCYPDIRGEDETALVCKNLSDFYLITQANNTGSVVPNDVCIPAGSRGVLVRGKNNSGKTVYMRSIGTAQLFAQAGLPVCADSAVISIRRAIFTHFAQAEKVAPAGDTSGHFEEEVKDMAKIIDAMEPYSLLMFNESFQSTAYDEGAEGLYEILKYVASTGSSFIAVTHLTKLFELFTEADRESAGVIFIHTEEGYKLATE